MQDFFSTGKLSRGFATGWSVSFNSKQIIASPPTPKRENAKYNKPPADEEGNINRVTRKS